MLLSEENIWKTIHDKREYSISGVALFKDGYIVVHDNKEKQEPRISYLDKKLNISKLIWPEPMLPFDLEAVARIYCCT